ncbi:lysoplasmalogenase [Solibacillus sp. CAU 1738]|uniref:lysoplasmalogenase n=1 Tax=Solibacillus sp. CAU 1738 TaxID=3140363 RepID=UPI003260C97F
MERKVLLSLFAIFGFYYVFMFESIDPSLKMIFKLIPMILLIVLALRSKGEPRYKSLVVIGLVFCAIGDYTLQWFIIGLTSFLIGHLFYIAAFRSTNLTKTPTIVKIILIAYGAAMMIWIAGSLLRAGDTVLAVAVCAYIVAILTMGWTSFRTSSKFAIAGAISFMASDSILAINKFVVDVPYSHILIMATYYGAQLLIALSIVQYSAIRNKMIQ